MKKKNVRLGIIGMSDGNGHPYSWSAIFNGYRPDVMQSCPFPVIPEYLGQHKFPDDSISGAEVTHIWTQRRELSEHIAGTSRIAHIVDRFDDMLGQVDGILLARDDAERHFEFASPYLKAGVPVYIDKPLAHSLQDAEHLLSLQQYEGQLFTCSALRFGKEFQLGPEERERLGPIMCVDAYTPKSWEKYAIHIIEPVLHILNRDIKIIDKNNLAHNKIRRLQLYCQDGLRLNFNTLGNHQAQIEIHIVGERSSRHLVFKDTFFAFREALKAFLNSIHKKAPVINRSQTLTGIHIIEQGLLEFGKKG